MYVTKSVGEAMVKSTCAFVGTALIFLIVLHELAGPRAVALAEGDARGNHPRDEARSAADPGMVLQRPALRAPLHREDLATRSAISRPAVRC